MSEAKVTLSDFSSTMVSDDERVRLVVKFHPVLDEEIELDTSASEIADMLESKGQYIYVEAHMPDGTTKEAVVEMQAFDSAFTGDPYVALKSARRVAQHSSSNGARRGNSEELAKIRAWAISAGHEVAPRGRIPQNIVAAYEAANSTS